MDPSLRFLLWAALRDGCWLVARWGVLWAALRDGAALAGRGARGFLLGAALDGCWLVAAPGRACSCARVPVAAERGAAFLVPRPIVVGSALQLVGRSVGGDRSGRARGQPSARPEDSCGPLGAPKPSEILALHTRGRGAARGDIKTPCDRRSKRRAAGAARTGPVAPFHHRGLPSQTRRAAAAHNATAEKQGRSHRTVTSPRAALRAAAAA